MTQASSLNPPIFIDLDGTLVEVDTLHETIKEIFLKNCLSLPKLAFSILGGKARFKRQAVRIRLIDVASLPYHPELLAHLIQEKKNGRHLFLATGADQKIAAAVAAHLKLFDGIIASDGILNLTGNNKLRAIRSHTNDSPFDYVGDNKVDLPLFLAARKCLLVNPSKSLLRKIADHCVIEKIFPASPSRKRTEK